jgi:DNA helicase-2/ATP-dependent DNA helicase PcrA
MQQQIEITTEQIKLAENILLREGDFFDPERVAFIKNLNTLDLHAVPGSGKTTALMAKLIAIEQHLPFTNGAGILVLSHTNAAVDEIKSKLGHLCPRLFSYPNFIGTIQGFADFFLTVPYYKMVYKRRPVRIDDEIYNENHYPDYKLKTFLARRADGKKLLLDYRIRDGDNLNLGLESTPFKFSKKTETYQKILSIKQQLRKNGFLCFDDAYILAQEYLEKFPGIINIIRKRFRYIFVDEMQDMDKFQYEMLEKLFAEADEIGYQRIGDKNQAIFSDESEMLDIWQERNVMELNGSHRLHPDNAAIVETLALSPIHVVGKRTNADGSLVAIKPAMFIYGDDTITSVIPSYAYMIKDLISQGKIVPHAKNSYTAIGWTTSKAGDKQGMIKLNHYHPDFSKQHTKLIINYPCLESYLFYYKEGPAALASIRKNILNAILRTLRLENITNPESGRSFSKRSLLNFFKYTNPIFYAELKLTIYQISEMGLLKKNPEALQLLVSLITNTLSHFERTIKESKIFIAGKHPIISQLSQTNSDRANYFSQDGIDIEINTVHAVKGQTHTCTLYLESFYQNNVGQKGQYESSRIADQLLGEKLPADAHKFIKQSLKMTYVGFSRATHLLGFAVHQTRFNSLYAGKEKLRQWNVYLVRKDAEPLLIDWKPDKCND